jgi:GNAT superfamily N-acetyltransferase
MYRFLAPLWVVPEYQHRGVASFLLRDGIELADQESPVQPMYLEAMRDARPIYQHFGFEGVEGPGADLVMIRNRPGEQGRINSI